MGESRQNKPNRGTTRQPRPQNRCGGERGLQSLEREVVLPCTQMYMRTFSVCTYIHRTVVCIAQENCELHKPRMQETAVAFTLGWRHLHVLAQVCTYIHMYTNDTHVCTHICMYTHT